MFGRADLIYREGAEAMTALYLIGDTLLYGCLALLIGFFSVQLIPRSYRPDVSLSIRWVRMLIVLMLLSFPCPSYESYCIYMKRSVFG